MNETDTTGAGFEQLLKDHLKEVLVEMLNAKYPNLELSQTQLAVQAGLHKNWLTDLDRRVPLLANLCAFCERHDLSVDEIIRRVARKKTKK
jgi:hypothetical protein